jgi:protoporphyrin/coproporphyrin ferrochelatase
VAESGKRIGLVLINLGTPRSAEPSDVGKYLREFLMDPYVIDIPFPLRWLLVNGLIVPRRSHQSSALYKKIWTPEGSPLLTYTVSLARKVQAAMGDSYFVLPAMRYGMPSIASALQAFSEAGVSSVIGFPLYPQYSLAATESSVVEFHQQADRWLPGVKRVLVPAFYARKEYLEAAVEISRPHVKQFDQVLFSFHGLPERQVKKTDPTGQHCLSKASCCENLCEPNQNCYRVQCFETARALAQKLGLAPKDWQVGFQSRLGRTPWIQPYSDTIYEELPKKGVKKLVVLTPSFVADCLETLEEVQIRGQEAFAEAGGETLSLVPSLNDHPAWVNAVSEIAKAYQPNT